MRSAMAQGAPGSLLAHLVAWLVAWLVIAFALVAVGGTVIACGLNWSVQRRVRE